MEMEEINGYISVVLLSILILNIYSKIENLSQTFFTSWKEYVMSLFCATDYSTRYGLKHLEGFACSNRLKLEYW